MTYGEPIACGADNWLSRGYEVSHWSDYPSYYGRPFTPKYKVSKCFSVHDFVNPGSQMGNQTADDWSDSNVSGRNTCHGLVPGKQANIGSGNEASYESSIEARVNSGREASGGSGGNDSSRWILVQGCTMVALMEFLQSS